MSFEFILNLLNILQATTFLLMLGILIGALDEWRHTYSTWKEVFSILLSFSAIAILLHITLYGIQLLDKKESSSITMSLLIFTWGFRVVAIASSLRVLWPAKYWWSKTDETLYPRLKLFIYSLLVLGLSFVPALLGLQ